MPRSFTIYFALIFYCLSLSIAFRRAITSRGITSNSKFYAAIATPSAILPERKRIKNIKSASAILLESFVVNRAFYLEETFDSSDPSTKRLLNFKDNGDIVQVASCDLIEAQEIKGKWSINDDNELNMIIERKYSAGKYLEYNVHSHFNGNLLEDSDLLFIHGNIVEETSSEIRDETYDQDREHAMGKFMMIPAGIDKLDSICDTTSLFETGGFL